MEGLGTGKDRVTLGLGQSSSDLAVLILPLFLTCFRVRGALFGRKVLKVLNLHLFLQFFHVLRLLAEMDQINIISLESG